MLPAGYEQWDGFSHAQYGKLEVGQQSEKGQSIMAKVNMILIIMISVQLMMAPFIHNRRRNVVNAVN